MKKIKRFIIAIILFFMFFMGAVVPIAYTGTAVFILGLYLKNQKNSGRFTSKIIDWIPLFGVILFLVLGMAFVEASEVADK